MTAADFSLSKTDLLPANEQAEAETLSGRLINSVHNAFSPEAALNFEQRRQRAAHSDQLAVVAADTIAMLPGLKGPTAGLFRATALIKLSGDVNDLAGNYLKDFAEGLALNKVSSLCFNGGAVASRIESRLGKTLAAETLTFAAAGAGMASVSTAFRPESWLENGQFSFQHGSNEILKAGIVGGAFAAPAGILGSKLSHLGMGLAAEGRISSSAALAISGLGSGYLSGVVIGGAQGLAAGGDFRSILQGAGEGGVAGALSGAIGLAGLASLNKNLKLRIETLPESELRTVRNSLAKDSVEKELSRTKDGAGKKSPELELWESLKIKQEKLNDSESSLADRLASLGQPSKMRLRYHVSTAAADEAAALSKTFSEFESRGGMKLVEAEVRVYQSDGIRVMIPETYARKLDEVLSLRFKAAEDVDIYVKGPVHGKEVLQARLDLEAHPLRERAHPADFVQLLQELPDRSLVKELLITDQRSATDAWHAKEYNRKGFRAAATASESGTITVYAQNRSPLLRDYIKHEWSHLLKWAAESESARFDAAAKLEKDAYYISEYSKLNKDENFAEHASALLHPDPDVFLEVVHEAPLRSVEIGKALMKSLGNARFDQAGSHQAEIARRIAYLQKEVMPQAREDLIARLKSGQTENAADAAELLASSGGPEEFKLLAEMARKENRPELREAAFTAAWGRVVQGPTRVSGYKDVNLENRANMRDFLVSMAERGSKSRELSLDFLSKFRDGESRFYYDLLTIDSYKGNKLSRAIELIERATDQSGRKVAWQEALKAVGSNKDERVNLALRALERHPRLAADAMDVLIVEAQPRTRSIVRDCLNHYNSDVAQKARIALAKIDMQQRVESLQEKLNSNDARERLQAVSALAATKDTRAPGQVLDAYLNAASKPEADSILAIAREKINPEVWKFELRRKKAAAPNLNLLLDKLMRT